MQFGISSLPGVRGSLNGRCYEKPHPLGSVYFSAIQPVAGHPRLLLRDDDGSSVSKALLPGSALQELRRVRGTQFDPVKVDAFLLVLDAVADGGISLHPALQPMDSLCAVT